MGLLLSFSSFTRGEGSGKSEFYGMGFCATSNARGSLADLTTKLKAGLPTSDVMPMEDAGVSIVTTPTFFKIRENQSINMAEIGIPFFYGDPEEIVAIAGWIESDDKERRKADTLSRIIDDPLTQRVLATVGAGTNVILSNMVGLVPLLPALVRGNKDDIFATVYYSARKATRYGIPEGQTVKYYPFDGIKGCHGSIRAEIVDLAVAEEVV